MSNAAAEKTNIVPLSGNALTPMDMLDRAVAQGASVEVLERLMGLKERFDANEARRAFDAAVADAKAEIKPIARTATGHNSKKYADFAAIARAVDPIITKHGLSYRFRTEQGDKINVTCILSHRAGHSENTTLSGPADTSGSKNAIQAIGSTLTYLQRYSLVQMLGLAASEDDDGKAMVSSKVITEAEVMELREIIESLSAEEPKVLSYVSKKARTEIKSLSEIPSAYYADVKTALSNWANKAKG
jgi:hypothetical protein